MTHDVLLLAIGSGDEFSTITNDFPEADRFAPILWKHDRAQRRMTESTSAISYDGENNVAQEGWTKTPS